MIFIKNKLNHTGFTLIELLIAMGISGVIMSGVYSAFKSQQDSYMNQDQVVEMQQNIRASLYIMTSEIRMAGYDPMQSDNFTITDIRSRDLDNGLDSSGNPALTFEIDLNDNGTLDSNETVAYSLYEFPVGTPADRDGIPDLSRTQGASGRQLLAESIIAMGFAYAYKDNNGNIRTDNASVDINGDGVVDTDDQVTVWAIDSNNDNTLDLNIDSNRDGIIDINDNVAGTALPFGDSAINIDNIVAIKIWLLSQTKHQDRKFVETSTFVVARQRIAPNNNFRHRLIEMTVKCRNMGI